MKTHVYGLIVLFLCATAAHAQIPLQITPAEWDSVSVTPIKMTASNSGSDGDLSIKTIGSGIYVDATLSIATGVARNEHSIPAQTLRFNDMAVLDDMIFTVTGIPQQGGEILRLEEGEETFTKLLDTPNPLFTITCPTPDYCVAGGVGVVYLTFDGGDTWTPVTGLPGAFRASEGVAVGETNYIVVGGTTVDGKGIVLYTDDDFVTTTTISFSDETSVITNLHNITLACQTPPLDPLNYRSLYTAADDTGTLYQFDPTAPASVRKLITGTPESQDLIFDVASGFCTDGSFSRARKHETAATDETEMIAVGEGGLLLYSSDSGETWDPVPSGTTQDLFTIDFPDEGAFGLIGGADGVLLLVTPDTAEPTALEAGPNSEAPRVIRLHANYPNPFNPGTTLAFTLARPEAVTLTIYDVSGRAVETLASGWRAAGRHQIDWQPQGLAGGVYYARLRAGGTVATQKLVLLK